MESICGFSKQELGSVLVQMLATGLRPDFGVSSDGKRLVIAIHGFNNLGTEAGGVVRQLQRLFGVPRLERRTFGDVTWLNGAGTRAELTLFRYLGPTCRVETYEETIPAKPERTLPAEPERVVTRTRVVCDEGAAAAE